MSVMCIYCGNEIPKEERDGIRQFCNKCIINKIHKVTKEIKYLEKKHNLSTMEFRKISSYEEQIKHGIDCMDAIEWKTAYDSLVNLEKCLIVK